MRFEALILGSGSANPIPGRRFPAVLVRTESSLYLVDCGEGTQFGLMKHKVNLGKISGIFISHLHADHYLGLFGLISTMNIRDRTAPLTIAGPRGLRDILTLQMQYAKTVFRYEIKFRETLPGTQELIFEDGQVEILTLPLVHKIECTGYLVKQKKQKLKIDPLKIRDDVPARYLKGFQAREHVLDAEGNIVHDFREFTLPETPVRSFAYCSDTIPVAGIEQLMVGVTTLYHEATFLEADKAKSMETGHSTAIDAARLADRAGATKLVIGHFSARYTDLKPFLKEAKPYFAETYLAEDGLTIEI